MTEIFQFPDKDRTEASEVNSTAYALERAEYVAAKMKELGLYEEAVDITREHFGSLRVRFTPDDRSTIGVDTEFVQGKGRQKPVWIRTANISQQHLQTYTDRVKKKISRLPAAKQAAERELAEVVGLRADTDPAQRVAVFSQSIALDWLMSELAVDVMYNSLSMQKTFGKYVQDYTSDYLLQCYSRNYDARWLDLNRLRTGFAQLVLRDDLIRRGIVATGQATEKVAEGLCVPYPRTLSDHKVYSMQPFTAEELSTAMGAFQPNAVGRAAQLSIAQVIRLSDFIS